MPCIIHIETSTQVCSMALSAENEIIFEKISMEGPSHAALAGVFVKEALDKLEGRSLDAVAVSSGPGSYTGLRIGVSLAKGLCFGYDIPLIAIPTLKLLALQAIEHTSAQYDLYCPMLDARRMEVYSAIYANSLEEIRSVQADIVEPETYDSFLNTGKVCFFGNGSAKCQTVIHSPNAIFTDGLYPSARYMSSLAEETFKKNQFEDVAYFEPFYLKDFQATVPKKML